MLVVLKPMVKNTDLIHFLRNRDVYPATVNIGSMFMTTVQRTVINVIFI
uniref:Uncharacterized protein n=1 Tax=Ciona intestinalis TaxID=7719 RepID=H2XJY1_CIOIN